MTGIPSKINMYNVYRDNNRLIGMGDELTLPDLESLTETISGPGILGEIEDPTIGHFGSTQVEVPFRVLNGDEVDMMDPTKSVDLTIRGSAQINTPEGGVDFAKVRAVFRGKGKSLTGGSFKQGSGMSTSVKVEATYYYLEVDGEPMIELDKLNSVFKVKGTDVLAKARRYC